MPRKSLGQQLLFGLSNEFKSETHESKSVLVLYRFNKNPSHRFYKILNQLARYLVFERLQNGVLEAEHLVDAYTLTKLIQHYGGESQLYTAQALEFLE